MHITSCFWHAATSAGCRQRRIHWSKLSFLLAHFAKWTPSKLWSELRSECQENMKFDTLLTRGAPSAKKTVARSWSRRFLWTGSTDLLKLRVIWKPWISSFIVGMIASSALGNKCVAAQNVEVICKNLQKFRKPGKWPHHFGLPHTHFPEHS